MAKAKDTKTEGTSRSSSEQAEANEHVARTPAGPVSPEGGPTLTGHTTEAGVLESAEGKVQAVHQTTVVTDPESDLAVQIPEGSNDGRALDPLRAHAEPSPNDVAAGADPLEASAEDTENLNVGHVENGKTEDD